MTAAPGGPGGPTGPGEPLPYEVAHGPELLERALAYALGAAGPTSTAELRLPTPCAGWDLGTLLRHLGASLDALREGAEGGRVGLRPGREGAASRNDPAAAFRAGASGLLGAWQSAPSRRSRVAVGGHPLGTGLLAAAGALELAVHGWDLRRTRHGPGAPGPPDGLAAELLRLAPLLVPPGAGRHGLFAPPVPVPSSAPAARRLLALLGRDPAPRAPERPPG